jgi:hypothetical protein
MVHHASPEIKPMLTRPWEQIWKTGTPRPPLSVHHFLQMWKANNAYIPPKTLADLASMEFWFHPALNRDKASVRWGAPVWNHLLFGTTSVMPIRTIGQLWAIKEGHIVTESRFQLAAARFSVTCPHLGET